MNPLSEHLLTDHFDPAGIHLVEASAGTGKTYSMETLYLRLVAAHGIPVEKLLVVTFTDAATAELRERLRAILEICRQRLETGDTGTEDRIGDILRLPLVPPPDGGTPGDVASLQMRRIRRALLDFDQAAIFTIHGFCQRTLNEFAFECGQDFDAEVIAGEALLEEICADRWRAIAYGNPASAADRIVQQQFPSPARLFRLASAYLRRHGAILLPAPDADGLQAARQRLDDALAAAVSSAAANGSAIGDDLSSEDSSPFFGNAAEEIRQRIARFGEGDIPRTGLPGIATALATALSPDRRPHRLPEGVRACVDACGRCWRIADENKIKFTARTGSLALPADAAIQAEWHAALGNAMDCIRRHRHDFDRFEQTWRRYPDAFAYADIAEPSTRATCFASLLDQDPKTIIAALKSIARLKVAAKKVTWEPDARTGEFIRALDAVKDAAAAPFADMAAAAELKTIAARFEARKRDEQGITFDDMLTRLLEALERDGKIADTIRGAYAAALIDEFQDTDPVQYRIFRKLFATGTIPLFLVGDPKQAIYSFRGGDIYTYCTARQGVPPEKRYDLTVNYRSRQSLIRAVNTVFRNRGDGESLFGHPAITYANDLACKGLDKRFLDEGEDDGRPFRIWHYQSPDGTVWKRPAGIDTPEAAKVYRDVAEEIVRLLKGETTGFAGTDGTDGRHAFRKLKASDIAILVRRHREAAYIHRELVRRGVPTVRQAADNVFDSAEARELVYLLRAMLEPGNLKYVRTALASSLVPVTGEDLVALSNQETVRPAADDGDGIRFPETMDDWLLLFRDAGARWRDRGYFAAAALLASRAAIKAHLAAQPGGERRLVNFVQLNDLLHRAATGQNLGPSALLAWVIRQLDEATRDANDAFETRLESDEDAVQIMTVFKSKGLEFPVVFVPTLWSGRIGERMHDYCLHHEESVVLGTATEGGAPPDLFMRLDTGNGEARRLAGLERAQEDIRNFYVAATRASYRTYVVTGDFCGEGSTLDKCLPPELLAEWRKAGDHGIDVCDKTETPDRVTRLGRRGSPAELKVKGTAAVDKSRGHASFSSIAPKGTDTPASTPDVNNVDAEDAAGDEPAEPGPLDIFSFPAGARTGDCWHRIFELLDFAADDATIRETVNAQLALSRLDTGTPDEAARKREITFTMVRRVLDNAIPVDDGPVIRLRDIPKRRKRAEMAFDFALRGNGPAEDDRQCNAVWTVLDAAWQSAADPTDEALFHQRLEHWTRRIPDGFMTGFIDLVFEHGGRYYILDWKSNRLGGNPANFEQGGLAREMAANAYFLQVLIYTVAVDRFLRQSLRDYDYTTRFGGVLYLFLRGIGDDTRRGIYYSRPPKDLIGKLSAALGTHAGGGLGWT